MELLDLYKSLKTDHENLMLVAEEKMKVDMCFRDYCFNYNGHEYILRFNLVTLDFIAKTKIPVGLRAKIKSHIIKEDYLKWKFKKEARAFFDFLRLYYKSYGQIVFTDSESPDFIIHEDKHYGYEITEATDAHNAMFNEAVYLLTGMENYTKEFNVYIKHIERTLTNRRRNKLEVKERSYHSDIYTQILECIEKKVEKYKHYEVELDSRNIIIFNNRIGFRRKSDFVTIGNGIKSLNIKNSNVDRIFIISGTRDLMVEFDTSGYMKKVSGRR